MPLPAYLRPQRPEFWLDGLSEPVRSELVYLERLLWGFWEYMARFDDAFHLSVQSTELKAIALAKALDKGMKYPLSDKRAFRNEHFDEFRWHWRVNSIAHRDAALSVFHGAKGLAAINRFAHTASKQVHSRIEFAALKKTSPLFGQLFPYASKLRNAVSHVGEANADERAHQDQALGFLNVPLINGISFGTKLGISCPGGVLWFEFAKEHVDGFRETARLIRSSMRRLEVWTRRRANRFLDRQELAV